MSKTSSSINSDAIEIQALTGTQDIASLFRRISEFPYPVWLDSSSPENGRYHILSALPAETFIVKDDDSDKPDTRLFFKQTQAKLNQFQTRNSMPGVPFQGGLIGYLSYDFAARGVGADWPHNTLIPEAYFGLYLWALIIDNLNQTQQLVFHPGCDEKTRESVLSCFGDDYETHSENSSSFRLSNRFTATIDEHKYASDLKEIDQYIHAGDVYQVNYAQHFRAAYRGDALQAYLKLRQFAPAPYSGYLKIGEQALLCHSPEQFLEVKGRHVRTSPIKGTAPRSQDARMDARNAQVLASSNKNRAENLMIVDLMRNDLGKHCVPGSVQVSKLFELKSFSNVHHLVSEVVGELKPASTIIDLVQSSIPAGSITGAPKKRAIEIIHELEAHTRSFYCGNLGYISLCGNTDFNIGIRSLVADGENLHCWGGGGIVADSDPTKEHEETLHKVGGLMTELEKTFLASDDQARNAS